MTGELVLELWHGNMLVLVVEKMAAGLRMPLVIFPYGLFFFHKRVHVLQLLILVFYLFVT